MRTNIIYKETPYYYFFKREKELDLFSLEYEGINYWQLIRFVFLKKITIKDLQVAGKSVQRSYRNELLGALRESRRMHKKFKCINRKDVIRIRPCVTITSEGKLDDHQYDYVDMTNSYCDLYALGNYANIDSCVEFDLARAELHLIGWKIRRKVIGCTDLLSEQEKILGVFLDDINEFYGTSFKMTDMKPQIEYSVFCHKYYKEEYTNIFCRIKPKLIIVYPHYDEHMFAATAAAKELGIKVIELQHGRINAHEAYWYEDLEEIGKLLPDYFFVYGQWWKDQIKMPPFVRIIVTGSPYLEKIMRNINEEKKDKNVLGVFSGIQSGMFLYDFILKNREYIEKNQISIIFKLHPNEFAIAKELYPELYNMKEVTVVYDEKNSFEVIGNSKYILAVSSTVIFEAIAFKEKDICILECGNHNIAMNPLIDAGEVRKIKSIHDIFENNLIELGNRENKGANFWSPNAQDTIRKELVKILNREY